MATAKKLSVEELKSDVSTWVTKSKIAQTTYNKVVNAIDGLLEKIGKIYTNDQQFSDKLAQLDGEFLSFGKQVEEWKADLILPVDYASADELGDLKSAYPTYRPAEYSYPLGDKVFTITRSIKELQGTVHNEGQLEELIMGIQRELTNSKIAYRYAAKRQMIGRLAEMCKDEMNAASATAWAAGTGRAVNTLVKNADNKIGIVVKPYPASANLSWEPAIAAGYIVLLDLVSTVKKPTDTATGEAFLKQIKADVETAGDISEGHSLNGNTLGASECVLLVKHGITNVLDVDVQAGAFNGDKVAIPAEIISVPDFGKDAPANVYAVLMDKRTLAVFPTFEYRGEAENVTGGYINYIAHYEAVPVISRNTFVKVYKSA